MKHLAVSFAGALLIIGSAVLAAGEALPKDLVAQRWFSCRIPDPPGWALESSDNSQTVFKRVESGAVETATVATIAIAAQNDDAFLRFAERRKAADFAPYEMVSIHFNDVRFKATPCVRYDGIFKTRNAQASDLTRLRTFGFLCRHPKSDSLAVDMSFSRTSADVTFPESSVDVGNAFLGAVTFTNAPPQ